VALHLVPIGMKLKRRILKRKSKHPRDRRLKSGTIERREKDYI